MDLVTVWASSAATTATNPPTTTDEDPDVRLAVIRNPNSPPEALTRTSVFAASDAAS